MLIDDLMGRFPFWSYGKRLDPERYWRHVHRPKRTRKKKREKKDRGEAF